MCLVIFLSQKWMIILHQIKTLKWNLEFKIIILCFVLFYFFLLIFLILFCKIALSLRV